MASFPALLERTPYGKDARPRHGATTSSRADTWWSYQDVRGRYQSEGRWVPIRDDPHDGFDTAQWIGAQPWSDGCIGTIGTSYGGATQHALAIANAPVREGHDSGGRHVRLRPLRRAPQRRVRAALVQLGVHAWGTPPKPQSADAAAMRAAADPAAAAALRRPRQPRRDYVRALPLRPGTTPLKFAPDYEAWLIEAMSHGDYDDFWKDHGSSVVDHLAEYKDVPVYHVTGWYDSWGTQVANLNFVELRKAKKSLQRLIVGPVDAQRAGRSATPARRSSPTTPRST